MTKRVKELAYQAARKAARPVGYLRGGSESKEELARELAQRDKINSGLIALFTALEPCLSYTIRGELVLVLVQKQRGGEAVNSDRYGPQIRLEHNPLD
jgi:hypothetical protein